MEIVENYRSESHYCKGEKVFCDYFWPNNGTNIIDRGLENSYNAMYLRHWFYNFKVKNADMAKHSVLVENSAVPAKKISNHKLGSKIKIDLVSKAKEARSIIKDLPLALATQFKNFLKTLRIEKSGIKIYLKRQKRMKYIILSKINKISLLNFVYILFSSINKIKKNVHEPNLSDMIKFCKQLPRAAKACLGEGISKLI